MCPTIHNAFQDKSSEWRDRQRVDPNKIILWLSIVHYMFFFLLWMKDDEQIGQRLDSYFRF